MRVEDEDGGERIEALEAVVRSLAAEVGTLREEVRALSAGAPRPHPRDATSIETLRDGAHPPLREGSTARAELPHRADAETAGAARGARPGASRGSLAGVDAASRAAALVRGVDLETLVGRYGTMALAALLTLMGIGAIFTWAASRGLLGPGVRLGLGVAAAAALAATGVHLRRRGARRYGDTLLALALAVVHVDAWGAGPYLGIIPEPAALAVAAAASVALAALAVADGTQALFAVGVGGALLAPFVTSSGGPEVELLLLYGWVVVTCALAALRGRDWRLAPRLLVAGATLYAGAGIGVATRATAPWWRADASALFAIACAWSAIAWSGGRERVSRPLSFLIIALGALLAAGSRTLQVPDVVALAALVAATAWTAMLRRESSSRVALLAGAGIPLGALAAALAAVGDPWSWRGPALAAAWSAAALGMAYGDLRARRGLHLAMGATAAIVAAILAADDDPLRTALALVAVAVAFAPLVRREREAMPLLPVLGALALATATAFNALAARQPFGYAPFLTAESLGALAVIVGWILVGRIAADAAWPAGSGVTARELRWLPLVGLAVAFLWVRAELGRAWSLDAATFALILFYAVAGVATIFVGRWRALAAARRVGLALALLAALKAVAEASGLTTIGLKVGSYLLVGCFLLAVAYWYRAAAEPDAEPARG